MSKPKPWLPNATPLVAGGSGFEPTAADWINIESVLGRPLDERSRSELTRIGAIYLGLRQVELDPPLASDAYAHLNAVEKAAAALHAAMQDLMRDEGLAVRRVAQLFDYSLAELFYEKQAASEFASLGRLEPAPRILGKAAGRVRGKLEGNSPIHGAEPEIATTVPTFAWDSLVAALAAFAEKHGMEASARKDDETSPFVKLVSAVQAVFPLQFKKTTQSSSALSLAISTALRTRFAGSN